MSLHKDSTNRDSNKNAVNDSAAIVNSTVADKKTVSIATFNLFNYLEPPNAFYEFERIYTAQQWQKKQQWITDYLAEHQPDIVGFQEVFSANSLEVLLQQAGYPYFSVVDEPLVIDGFIFKQPVVAIASRFPIVDVAAVKNDVQTAVTMGISEAFDFSRKVLRATIDFPHIGLCDCYVVHFKSKRPSLSFIPTADNSDKENFIQEFTTEIAGSWASSVQRGSEAALLLIDIIKRRQDTGFPMMLMGDFNNDLFDGVLSHLLTHSFRRTQPKTEDWLKKSSLSDSWHLYEMFVDSDSQNAIVKHKRTPTHYYGTQGNVLDYILLSCEFDASYQGSCYEVYNYQVYDRHLINPSFERDGYSTDHGIVLVSLALRE